MPVIWLTGLSGAGKSTIAEELSKHIDAQIVDGDVVRKTLISDLKHGNTDRIESYRRAIKCIKGTLNSSKFVVAAFVSPEKEQRDWVKSQFEKDGILFYQVFIEASLETCQTRDVKGLYKRFHNGEDIKLAGLTEKYEKPDNADLVCNTDTETIQECVAQILAKISSV